MTAFGTKEEEVFMSAQSSYAVPESVLPYVGKMLDLDGHEHVPVNLMVETFGGVAQRFVDLLQSSSLPTGKEAIAADDAAIDAETVWSLKYAAAPGIVDMRRRMQVLDLMGVRRQLIFSGGFGIQSLMLYMTRDEPEVLHRTFTTDRAAYARQCLDAFNDWCARVAQLSPQLRPAAILIAETPEELIADAQQLIQRGVRCFWAPPSLLPGGLSPAHTGLAPLYNLFEEAAATLCFHAGANHGLFRTEAWRDAPALSGFKIGGEFSLDPWTLSTVSRASENFLTVMVLGGVFDRHPNLRVVFSEVAANWVGPLAYNMDMWVDSGSCMRPGAKWTMDLKPSEYMQRNVRVSPFFFEDVGDYIARYGLEEIYCYASDYPHIEGGVDPMVRFSASLKKHGHDERVARKFFVENAKWALPD